MRDGTVEKHADGLQEDAVLGSLNMAGARVIRIDEGDPAPLPAPVLPESGDSLPAFVQESPRDEISGWVRLRIAGYLAVNDGWDGVIVTSDAGVRHWIQISAGEAVSTQSFLTPRLIDVLGGADMPDEVALADSLSRPERLAAHLRSAELAREAQAITGHLIGAELAAARVYWLGQQVAVLDPPLASLAAALEAQGVPCMTQTPTELIGPGLTAVGAALGLQD